MTLITVQVDESYLVDECPFLGSRNTCGAMENGGRTNACPEGYDDEDNYYHYRAPFDCPLRSDDIMVRRGK